ncbi:MAG: acyl carrier protein [Gemmatimonadota bacterium]
MRPASEAEAYVRAVIGRVTARAPDAFGPDEDLARAVGLDSLSLLQVVAEVEEAYDVRIPDGEMDRLRTLRDFLAQVQRGD